MRGICRNDILTSYDNKETYDLLNELNNIRCQLNKIFDSIGCERVVSGTRTPYIYEKVNYCLEKCNDKIVLNNLNELYKKYYILRNEIFNLNINLIYIITNEYQLDYEYYMEDIIQCSYVGLMKVIEGYDINSDESFSIYAYNNISRWIIRELGSLLYSIKIPQRSVESYHRIIKRYDKLCQLLGREATIKEVATYMNLPLKEVGRTVAEFSSFHSLDESTFMNDKNQLSFDGKRDELLSCLRKQLTNKQYFVLVKLYGLEDRVYTASELSEILDISRQQVYVVRKNALIRLRRNKNLILDVFKD